MGEVSVGCGSATVHTYHVDTGPGLTKGSTVMDQLLRFTSYHHEPWNKGKLVGQKAPLKLKDIWAIRVRLQLGERARELALFNLAIDSKLRSCDLVKLRVRDVTHGIVLPHEQLSCSRKPSDLCSLKSQSRRENPLGAWIRRAGLRADDYLFPSRLRASPHVSTRQYARIVRSWVSQIGLDSAAYGTHTLRRTKASLIYRPTQNLRAVAIAAWAYQAREHG